MISRRQCTAGVLVTSLAASSFGLSACAQQVIGEDSASEQPARVASVMQSTTNEAETSPKYLPTAARETSLTARGFMDYLDEEQRAALLGDGLDLSQLTWAQQITAMRVLESLLNEETYQLVSTVLTSMTQDESASGFAGHHILKFNGEPDVDRSWNMALEGPTVGLNASFTPESTVNFQSGYIGLDAQQVAALTAAAGTEFHGSPIHDNADTLLKSLSKSQRDSLQIPSDSDAPGLKGSELNDEQKQLLLDITSQWISVVDQSEVESKQQDISNTINDTYFAWSEDSSAGTLFRVSGPEVFLEYEETPSHAEQGAPSIHAEFKDPTSGPQ